MQEGKVENEWFRDCSWDEKVYLVTCRCVTSLYSWLPYMFKESMPRRREGTVLVGKMQIAYLAWDSECYDAHPSECGPWSKKAGAFGLTHAVEALLFQKEVKRPFRGLGILAFAMYAWPSRWLPEAFAERVCAPSIFFQHHLGLCMAVFDRDTPKVVQSWIFGGF